jgi:hypothetical protein
MNLSGSDGLPWELLHLEAAVAVDPRPSCSHPGRHTGLEIAVAMVLWTVAAVLMLAGFLSEHP